MTAPSGRPEIGTARVVQGAARAAEDDPAGQVLLIDRDGAAEPALADLDQRRLEHVRGQVGGGEPGGERRDPRVGPGEVAAAELVDQA